MVFLFLELRECWAKERTLISSLAPSPPARFCTLGLHESILYFSWFLQQPGSSAAPISQPWSHEPLKPLFPATGSEVLAARCSLRLALPGVTAPN